MLFHTMIFNIFLTIYICVIYICLRNYFSQTRLTQFDTFFSYQS